MSDLNPFSVNQSDQNAAIQSLLQGGMHLQDAQAQSFQDGGGVISSCAGNLSSWQQCRVCQQSFFTTVECIQEHEISCQLNLQVQNFLHQQQQQQQQQEQCNQMAQLQAQAWQQVAAQNEFQHQLQIQQNQLQMQLNQQQNQFDLLDLAPAFGNEFGRTVAPTINASLNNIFQTNDFASQPTHQDQVECQFRQNQVQYSLPEPPTSSSPNHFTLALASDDKWLTPLHCFVRRYCVEAFIATSKDIAAPCMGKRNPLSVDQVGIRCPYCSPERVGRISQSEIDDSQACENGVVYPSIISRIYNSSINLLQRHLRLCPHVPPEILTRYEELKSSNARSGASKKYWVDSAITLGLVDTPHGIRLDKEVHSSHRRGEASDVNVDKKDGAQAQPLVLPSDKRSTTAFTFHLLSQMQPCVFSEADRLGRRRGLKVGFTGLACRHCYGIHGSGRFFPSSVKTMADASKSLDVIYRHVMKCKNCPWEVKERLRNLREVHDSERNNMPFGNQRAFFVKVWHRLHANSDVLPLPLTPHDLMATKPTFELNQFANKAA